MFHGQLPAHVKLSPSKRKVADDAMNRKKKGKCIEGEDGIDEKKEASSSNRLATLDIFAGCGGLSEGLQKSGQLISFIVGLIISVLTIFCQLQVHSEVLDD